MHQLPLVTALIKTFEANRNVANAAAMSAYLKHRFSFYGIKTPERKALLNQVLADHHLPKGEVLKHCCRQLWQQPQRELHHAALDLLEKQLRRLDESFLEFVEELLPQNAWWDSVDVLSPRLAGGLLKKFPEQIEAFPNRWIQSDNFWMQRAAILFQLKYRGQTNGKLLFSYILRVADSEEFFLQKAAGWALRNYSRYDPKAVTNFIANNKLAKLTVREGGRLLKDK